MGHPARENRLRSRVSKNGVVRRNIRTPQTSETPFYPLLHGRSDSGVRVMVVITGTYSAAGTAGHRKRSLNDSGHLRPYQPRPGARSGTPGRALSTCNHLTK
jgi:hypothetical protein